MDQTTTASNDAQSDETSRQETKDVKASLATLPSDIILLMISTPVRKNEWTLKYSGVSRHWRAVITGSPGLWTSVPMHNLDLAKLYLDRSDGLPLELTVGCESIGFFSEGARIPTDGDTAVFLPPHLDRVRTLEIYDYHDEDAVFRSWLRFFSDHGPLATLQHLTIRVEGSSLGKSEEDVRALQEPTNLWGPGRRSPRTLHLRNALFPPTSNIYADLTSLVIESPYTNISLAGLLRILSASPRLREFRLEWAELTKLRHRPVNGPTPFAHLAHIALLYILPSAATAFLACLALPSGLASFRYISETDETAGPLPMPSQTFPDTSPIGRFVFHGGTISRYGDDREDCEVSAYRSTAPAEDDARMLELLMDDGPQTSALFDLVRWLAPSLAHVECVTLSDIAHTDIAADAWRAGVLVHMPRLKTLRVLGCAPTESLLDALATAPALCAYLETLEVSEFPFERDRQTRKGAAAAAAWTALTTLVAARRTMGVPLKTLSLFDVSRPPNGTLLRSVREGVERLQLYVWRVPRQKPTIGDSGVRGALLEVQRINDRLEEWDSVGSDARQPWVGGFGAMHASEYKRFLKAYKHKGELYA